MLIELRKGVTLHPCTLNAVIAPEKVMISALNNNTDLQRFLFLYVSGNYSRLLSSINRSSKNFEVRRAFTAHQLFTILKEVSHTVVLLEHDPTLFEGAENMLPQIAGMLKDISCESLVILYTPSIDRPFSVLMRQASHIIELGRWTILSGLQSITAHDHIAVAKPYRTHSGLWRYSDGKEF
jgi:DNA polymerase I